MSGAEAGDNRWLHAAQAGDGAAFAALVQPHLPALGAFIRRAAPRPDLAEDILQDTLLRAWRHLASFRGESSFRTWLFAIAWRAAKTAAGRAGDIAVGDVPDVPDPSPGPEDQALGHMLAGQVVQALERLRPPWREAIRRVDVRGQPLAVAAAEMGIPLGTLKTYLHRGRRALAQISNLGEGMGHTP